MKIKNIFKTPTNIDEQTIDTQFKESIDCVHQLLCEMKKNNDIEEEKQQQLKKDQNGREGKLARELEYHRSAMFEFRSVQEWREEYQARHRMTVTLLAILVFQIGVIAIVQIITLFK